MGPIRAVSRPEGWDGDGIIARITRQSLAKEIADSRPADNQRFVVPVSGEHIARCTVDPEATGRMAAEYFLSVGFKQFGYCGPLQQLGYNDPLAESFSAALEKKGQSCLMYSTPGGDQLLDRLERPFGQPRRVAQTPAAAVAVLGWSAAAAGR